MAKNLSSLKKLIELEKDAANFGFGWLNHKMIIDQAISECHEVHQAIIDQEGSARIQEEIGDLIQASISLCLYLNYDVEETLTLANKKFEARMNRIKEKAKEKGYDNLKNQSEEFLIALWKECKE